MQRLGSPSFSSLSSLTPEPDDVPDPLPEFLSMTSAAEKAYALVRHGISALESQLAGVQLVPERLRDVTDSMKCGKSTLLNALLQHRLLPDSGEGTACTAVVTEISYSGGPDITANIIYKSPATWKLELDHLVADALEAVSEESEATSHLSPAYQAREKLRQIYPHLGDSNVSESEWNVDSLLADATVSGCLGTAPIISASDHGDLGKALEQFLSSRGDRTIWPLVQSVHIKGPFPVLSTGITLIDLPGHGDVDNTRNKVADEYMRDASAVFFVTSIARAIDERVRVWFLAACLLIIGQRRTRTVTLEKYLSQIIVDGRIGEKSIALILTNADIPFDKNDAGSTKIAKLTEDIENLKKKIERRSSNDQVNRWKDQLEAS
ncbi:Dynamin family-domain-containing protein [Mycena olivaceomarginata]|nr:Dynamin family-domain-containing protein [Mycena olivaceomarginata]